MSTQRTAVYTLGERIRKAREDNGWQQADLALHVKKSRSTITNWEANKHRPSALELDKIAEVTGYAVDFFFDVPPEATIRELLGIRRRHDDLVSPLKFAARAA